MKIIGVKIASILSIILIIITLFSCSIESYSTKKFVANNEIISYLNDNG